MSTVLVVYGSESGNSQHVAQSLVQKWKQTSDVKFKVVPEAMSGNEAAEHLVFLKDVYDILVVCTSSFGEGDPPDNYQHFLLELTKAAQAGKRPLDGMQHAVLGFGDSNYETFMNNPRLSDKLLGECGSRRIHKRYEIDAGATGDEAQKMAKLEEEWKENVFNLLQSGPKAADKPACDWCEEGVTDKIFPKSISDLGGGGFGGTFVAIGVGALAVAVGVFFYFHNM